MKIEHHACISIVVSSALFLATKSWVLTLTSFLSGIFIDIDHLFDYFINEKKIRFDIKDFFYKCNNIKLSRVFLFLHSYEFLLVIGIFQIFFSSKILLGILIGFSTHILFDIFGNNVDIKSYLFFYRLKYKFNPKKIFKIDDSPD